MTGSTSNYGLPYPVDGDSLASAVKTTPKALAEAIDAALGTMAGIANGLTNGTLVSGTGTARAYRRGFHFDVLVEYTATSARAAFDQLATFPTPVRPLATVQGVGFNTSTSTAIGVYLDAAGILRTRNAIANGQTVLLSLPAPI